MAKDAAILAAVAEIEERFGPHGVTRGWSPASRVVRAVEPSMPPWWPGAPGYRRPAVFELIGPRSCGKLSLALRWLAAADQGGVIAVLDESGSFYPASAATCGLELERLVVVRPPNARQAVDAAGVLVGSGGFDAVLWVIGERTRLSGMASARLAQSAGRQGTVLLGLTAPDRDSPFVIADLRLRVVGHTWRWEDGALAGVDVRVRTERLRGADGEVWEIGIGRELRLETQRINRSVTECACPVVQVDAPTSRHGLHAVQVA